MANAEAISVICHGPGAWRLQLQPRGLGQLQQLLDEHSFWAQGRSRKALRQMLQGSQAIVSSWQGSALIGFGRATSDGLYRAVLWDVVVDSNHQGQGLGRRIVETLLQAPALKHVERTYLMTTNSAGFYSQLGFEPIGNQQLMLKKLIEPSG
jgi:N-acetylglutamate synthase-like GNAT family acetyltransferase